MAEKANKNFKNRAIISGLLLLFFLPILVSWYLVFFTDFKPGDGGTEHGVLISPPRKLEDLQLVDPLTDESHALYERWNMFTIIEGDCDRLCINDLYRMRQIRLAMGKNSLRVQRVVYFSDPAVASKARELFNDYAGQLLVTAENINEKQLPLFNVTNIDRQHALYLIDPAGFIMMIYPADTNPGGIIKDLEHLLRISQQN